MPIYTKVVLFGATSGVFSFLHSICHSLLESVGIGKALAERMIAEGIFVIAIGRRTQQLNKLLHEHGPAKVQASQFDITQLAKIPAFVQDIMTAHPDVDCVVLNSGIQRRLDFTKPETVDMQVVQAEMTTNYLSHVFLTKEFLRFLSKKRNGTHLIYTTSSLALVPLPRVPNYCASKAAMHSFILAIRDQLARTGSKVKIVEIFPPAVQTELHDAKHQPDLGDKGHLIGIPLGDFADKTWQRLKNDEEQIAVGNGQYLFNAFEKKRQELFQTMWQ